MEPATVKKSRIACPRCGKRRQITVFGNLDVTAQPQYKAQVLDGSLFRFVCRDCGYDGLLSYPCLYQDSAHKLLIYLAPGPEGAERTEQLRQTEATAAFVRENCLLRAVPTQKALAEKILIFDNLHNDRLIELAKAFTLYHLSQTAPDMQVREMYYAAGEQGEGFSCFCADGRYAECPLTPELLQTLRETFGEKLRQETLPPYAAVDQRWAQRFLEHSK